MGGDVENVDKRGGEAGEKRANEKAVLHPSSVRPDWGRGSRGSGQDRRTSTRCSQWIGQNKDGSNDHGTRMDAHESFACTWGTRKPKRCACACLRGLVKNAGDPFWVAGLETSRRKVEGKQRQSRDSHGTGRETRDSSRQMHWDGSWEAPLSVATNTSK